jgi:hypothetical protein
MPGKVTRSIRLASGPIVQITVPINATKQMLRDAIAEQASKVSPDLTRDLKDIGVEPTRYFEQAAAPKSALAGFEKRKTAKEVTAPLEEVRPTSAPSYWKNRLADQGEIRNRETSFRDIAEEGASGLAKAAGVEDPRLARHIGGSIADALDLTPYGSLDIATEGYQDLTSGRLGEAAGNLGMAALDLVPGAGHAAGMALAGGAKFALPALAKGGSALSMFLGPSAKKANLQMLEKAKLMADAGADREQIWKETGWFNQHGDWKFEISDLGLNVKKGILPARGKATNAGNVISHPVLEENYPEFRGGIFGNPLRVGGHIGGRKSAGAYYPDPHVMTLNANRPKPAIVSTAAHELQHGLPQVTEDFPMGARVGEHPPIWGGPNVEQAEAAKKSFTDLLDTLPDEIWDDPAVKRQLRAFDDKINELANYEGYRRSAGETEARNVQERLKMEQSYKALGWDPEAIAKQMRDTPPWLTQDVPDELQNVKRAEPIIGDPRPGRGPQLSEDLTTPLEIDQTLPAQMDITAYHGSPHDFDRFDSSKIGMGEGAQAYGHGLYFSENPDVARSYRDALKRGGTIDLGSGPLANQQAADAIFARLTEAHGADVKVHNVAGAAADMLARHGDNAAANLEHVFRGADEYQPIVKAAADILRTAKPSTGGSLYETNIKAELEDFIDWDKPLDQQSEKAKTFLNNELTRYLGTTYDRQIDNFKNLEAGEILSQTRGVNASSPQTAQAARDAGLAGIRYLDQGSRGAGEGTRNYVVFDDSKLDILKRNDQPLDLTGATMQASEEITGGRQPALERAFEGVTDYAGALERATAGKHLRLDAEGNVMGSPGVAPNALAAWRNALDAKIANANQEGLGWYDKSRGIIDEVSDTPEMASLFARGGAVYSPQASPVDETNFWLRHHNERVLTGLEPQVTTGDRAKAANLGYGDVGENSGFINLTPEDITLGKKTGPYATSKDPTVPMGWAAANDLWQGRAYGYAPEPGQAAFDRAFQPNEHAFLTGENVLATDRARAAGTLPPDASVPNMQEVVWVEERKQSFLNKENAKYAAGKRATPPTEEEALVYARQGIGSGIERNTAILSREFTPGGGLGEFPGMSADPELNARFAADMAAAGGNPKNSVLSSMQLYQRPTVSGEGFWNDPVEGLQRNPAFMDRPLVGLSPEMVGGSKGGPAMDPHSRNAMLTAGQLFGIENVQHGVGANIFVPQVSTHKAGQLNGLYFGPEGRQEAMDKAVAAGLDVVDNGDGGIVVTSFNDDTAAAAKKVKEFSKGNGGKLGRFDSNYAPSNLPEEQGTGEATKSLLEATGSIPGLEQRLATSDYPAEVAARNEVRQKYAAELATSLRPDVQKLRDLLARGGPAAVRDWVTKNGLKGLPVWTGVLLGGGAMLSSQDQAQPAPL